MYLWCSVCNRASLEVEWNTEKFKYGVCPVCGCSAFRNAVEWEAIYKVNEYESIPIQGQVYSLSPIFDIYPKEEP